MIILKEAKGEWGKKRMGMDDGSLAGQDVGGGRRGEKLLVKKKI